MLAFRHRCRLRHDAQPHAGARKITTNVYLIRRTQTPNGPHSHALDRPTCTPPQTSARDKVAASAREALHAAAEADPRRGELGARRVGRAQHRGLARVQHVAVGRPREDVEEAGGVGGVSLYVGGELGVKTQGTR